MQGLSTTVSMKENPTSSSRTSGPIIVPYTISNRYYSAEIHFAAYELQAVHAGLFSLDRSPDYKPPPAVVFVWIDGEVCSKILLIKDLLTERMNSAICETSRGTVEDNGVECL